MKEFTIVRKRLPHPDSIPKVTGRAKFTADLVLPGMLAGKILRSTRHHARLVHLDVSPALKVPGVKAVITAKDLPPVIYGFGERRADMTVFAIDRVRYKGDEIAAVAAVDEEAASEALERIVVEYEDLPAVFDPEEAVSEGLPNCTMTLPTTSGCVLISTKAISNAPWQRLISFEKTVSIPNGSTSRMRSPMAASSIGMSAAGSPSTRER